jgi:hypothetical protein
MRAQNPPCPWDEHTCAYAAKHLPVLKWLRAQNPPCPWNSHLTKEVAREGCFDTLRWVLTQDPPCPYSIDVSFEVVERARRATLDAEIAFLGTFAQREPDLGARFDFANATHISALRDHVSGLWDAAKWLYQHNWPIAPVAMYEVKHQLGEDVFERWDAESSRMCRISNIENVSN